MVTNVGVGSPWFSMFMQVLKLCEKRLDKSFESVEKFLDGLTRHPFPLPGETFVVKAEKPSTIPGERAWLNARRVLMLCHCRGV